MGSYGGVEVNTKPHAVCIPFPAQGHIGPMLKLAKLLHSNGLYITFVNTEYNHRRLSKSGCLDTAGSTDFCFEAIPDGLPNTGDDNATQHIPSLCDSTTKNCLAPFIDLLNKLNGPSSRSPPVTWIVSDGSMSFTLDASEKLGIPEVMFWTPSVCGLLGYIYFPVLAEKGFTPLKDESYLTNGYLDTIIDWLPGLKVMRLKDIPSFIRTTDPDEIMFNYMPREASKTPRASAVILNTFDALEQDALEALSSIFPPLYTIGPFNLLAEQELPDDYKMKNAASNLWKADPECIKWLDRQTPDSVLFVNFGSIAVASDTQLIELAWGLANSKHPFLWIIRPDLISGESAVLSGEFLAEIKGRGMLASWCDQEKVLNHPSTGGFLSHMGWNSTLESISAGVPMICWPYFSDQMTNTFYASTEWGNGMELNSDVKREEVESLVRELMEGDKGKQMKKKAAEWKLRAEEAIKPGGSSYQNFKQLLAILLHKKKT